MFVSMKLQTLGTPNCGAVSLCNALRCFGVELSEDSAVYLCGTSEDGTDESDIMRACDTLNVEYGEQAYYHRGDAQYGLQKALRSGHPCILAVDDYSHWVTVIGLLGVDNVVVVDPDNDDLCAVVSLDELCDRWECSPAIACDDAPFYGLLIKG